MKKQFLLVLVALPLLSDAQHWITKRQADSAGVRAMYEYKVLDGEKTLENRTMFDTAGNIISSYRAYHADTLRIMAYDTVVDRNDGRGCVWINLARNNQPDSEVCILNFEQVKHVMISESYKKGMIVRRSFSVNDTVSYYSIDESLGEPYFANVTRGRHTYDEQGRCIAYERTDSIVTHDQGYASGGEGYTVVYEESCAVYTHYRIEDGKKKKKRITHRTFEAYDHTWDSTVMFTEKGKIGLSFKYYFDKEGKIVQSVTYDRSGKVTHYNTYTYTDSLVTIHYTTSEPGYPALEERYRYENGLPKLEIKKNADAEVMEQWVFEYEYY